MRKLSCFQAFGFTVQEVLDQFNERAAVEFGGVKESDIVSVIALPPTRGGKIPAPSGALRDPNYEVVIVYWSDL